MRCLLLILFLMFSFVPPALADCTSPAGAESATRYDFSAHKLHYCDGTSWVQMGGAGDNLGNHIASTVLRSDTHNTDDLGTSAVRWRDGWFAGTVSGGSFAGSGAFLTALNAANLASGVIPAARLPAYTGDVTKDAGGTATVIANNAVTNAKIADGAIIATAKLSATGTKNNTTFLRGDNTWAVPAGGGGGGSNCNAQNKSAAGMGKYCGDTSCSPTTGNATFSCPAANHGTIVRCGDSYSWADFFCQNGTLKQTGLAFLGND